MQFPRSISKSISGLWCKSVRLWGDDDEFQRDDEYVHRKDSPYEN